MPVSRHQEFLDSVQGRWRLARIDEIGTIESGGTPSRDEAAFWGGPHAWVTPGEVTQLRGKYVAKTNETLTDLGLACSSATSLRPGSLLVTSRATIGDVKVAQIPVATNQGFKSIIPKNSSLSDYYFHLLQFISNEMRRLASGSTFDEISKRDFAAILVPCPPLAEQRRIAEILDTVDEAIRQTEADIAKLKQLKAGLLHDLLTRGIDEHGHLRDPAAHPEQFRDSPLGRIPVDWRVAGFDDVGAVDRPSIKTGPFGSALKGEHWVSSGVPVITIGSLGEGEFIESELLYVSEMTARALSAYRLIPGDLVFSRVADVGRSVVVDVEHEGWLMSSNLMRLSVDTDQAVPAFVHAQITASNAIRQQIRRAVNAGGREIANTPILRSLLLAWPPMREQKRILRALQAHDLASTSARHQLDKMRLVKDGLASDLLTGSVRVEAVKEVLA